MLNINSRAKYLEYESKMIVKSKVSWVGTPETDVYIPKNLRIKFDSKNCYFYKKCIYGAFTLKVGDFVLITCAGSVDSDSVESCEIAKILHLYEIEDGFQSDDDPYQAIVQWYSRPYKIPHRLFDDDSICIDFNLELIEDHRAFDPVVSIDSIYKKCTVVCGSPVDSAQSLMPRKRSAFPSFVCRYKIVKVAGNHHLIPLNDMNFEERLNPSTPSRSERARTPKSGSKRKSESKKTRSEEIEFVNVNDPVQEEPLVSPIKIIRNSVVKTNRSSQKKKKLGENEVNGNYLLESPDINRIKSSYTPRKNGARRNLNISLEANSTADSDTLNYSIIQDSPSRMESSDLKIKLRLSETQKEAKKRESETSPTSNITIRRSQRFSTDTQASVESVNRRSARKRTERLESVEEISPSKKVCEENASDYPQTPSTKSIGMVRRKSILKTPTGRQSLAGTPKRGIQLSNIIEEVLFNVNSSLAEYNRTNTPRRSRKINYDREEDFIYDEPKTPKSRRKSATTPNSKSSTLTPTQKMKLIRSGAINPAMETRECKTNDRKSDFQIARERLHVSAVPKSLPCREQEFQDIYKFLEGKLFDQCGGCMYVSGVPGTGKTATVTGVIRALKRDAELEKVPEFDYIEINGMRLTEPRQAYVQIYKQLTGKTVSWEHAHTLLDKRFNTPGPKRLTTILLVDELDILCNRRQDVVYNLLDWPTKSSSRLVVVTIANTMDLPERMLMSKVTSRLGLTRLTFQPYSHKQLQEIVTARLSGSEAFKSDALQLVARKVAAVSGDARRALDICRRATEVAEENPNDKIVSMIHVQKALNEMIATLKVQAIKKCSKLEKLFLQAVAAEVARTGVEETTFLGVYTQLESLGTFLGTHIPVPGRALQICSKLGAERLLICEHSRTDIFMKILLNVSSDDIHFALQV